MRLDKYLKLSGLIPRRTVAKEACDAGRVTINGQVAKAASDVQAADRLRIDLGRGVREVEVLEVPSGQVGRDRRSSLYRVLRDDSGGGSGPAHQGSEGSP